MKNTIKIQGRYLIFRDQALRLKQILEKKFKISQENEIYLDFSKVIFVSRSFADELLNILSEFALNKKYIKIIGQTPAVKIFLNIVKKTKEKIQKEVFSFSQRGSKI
ncbi:DUF4325 domain-containing protein [Patescibacteria group bacterium]|nr:DUF4325 domain-containing protein [Patescibacteria group bacterium]